MDFLKGRNNTMRIDHNGLENTTIRLIEMTKATQNLKIKFNKGIEILIRTQAEMKLELKTQ